MKKIYTSIGILILSSLAALDAQTCWSGGTGADGAYNATANTTLAGGIYNFSTFTIAAGDTVLVTGTQPLIIHCTGAATIYGTLAANGGNGTNGITSNTNGIGGIGVAGGGNGGDGVYSVNNGPLPGIAGSGQGATTNQGDAWSGGGGAGYATAGDSSGNAAGGLGGPSYGTIYLLAADPGSGGGGGSGGYSCGGGGGGAGGGYISIQAAGGISINGGGSILANGGNGGSDGVGNCGGGGGGSGGGIWLAGPTVNVDGNIRAIGGIGGASNVPGAPYFGTGANGANGRIRLDYSGTFSGVGTITPASNDLPLLTATISETDETAAPANDGTATVVVSGGAPAYSYSWAPTGGTNANATGLDAGTYTCTITDANGCSITQTVTVGTQLGISVSTDFASMSLFPNPSNGPVVLNVQLKEASSIKAEIFSTLGECVFSKQYGTTNSLNETLDLSAFPAGLYSIRIAAGENQMSKNILVQH